MKPLLILAFVLFPVLGAAQTRTPIYIFTATDPSGLVDADTTARLKMVTDLKKALASSKQVLVADAAEGATLTLEIQGTTVTEEKDLTAATLNNIDRLNGGFNAAKATRSEMQRVTRRHATLRTANYATEIDGKNANWLKSAVESWVKANQTQLPR